MDGTFEVICAMCGADLTVAQEHWDNKSVLRPLVSIEVMPCCTCMTRTVSDAVDEASWHHAVDTARLRGSSEAKGGENHE